MQNQFYAIISLRTTSFGQVNACYREGAFQARSQVPMSGTEGTATANFKFVSSAATQAPARNIRI